MVPPPDTALAAMASAFSRPDARTRWSVLVPWMARWTLAVSRWFSCWPGLCHWYLCSFWLSRTCSPVQHARAYSHDVIYACVYMLWRWTTTVGIVLYTRATTLYISLYRDWDDLDIDIVILLDCVSMTLVRWTKTVFSMKNISRYPFPESSMNSNLQESVGYTYIYMVIVLSCQIRKCLYMHVDAQIKWETRFKNMSTKRQFYGIEFLVDIDTIVSIFMIDMIDTVMRFIDDHDRVYLSINLSIDLSI